MTKISVELGNQLQYINSMVSRTMSYVLGQTPDGKRNVYDIYGYPVTLGDVEGFRLMHAYAGRHGVANRITHGIAKLCWRDGVNVLSDVDDEDSALLEDELQELPTLQQSLERADILGRVGKYSLLLVGVPDGLELDQPLGRVSAGKLSEVYFKTYAYDQVTVETWEDDVKNPRYGQPLTYKVQASTRANDKRTAKTLAARVIHQSRVVLFAENYLEDALNGTAALEPVFNRILDLDKTCGGSAEAYFRNARNQTGYEIDKDFATTLLNDDEARAKFDEGARNYTNNWQSHTIAAGAKIKNMQTSHSSPLDTVKVLLWEISSQTHIPVRLLTGEGSGQLAGSEDQQTMNQITADRQRAYCSPRFMDALRVLEACGLLTVPDGAVVVFPQQQSVTEKDQAEIDNKRADTFSKVTTALSTIGGDNVDAVAAFTEFGLTIDVTELDDDDDDDEPLPPEGEE